MRKLMRPLRVAAAVGALVVTGALLSGTASARQAYDPPDWNPPAGHEVTTVRWGPITIPGAEGGQPGQVENEIAQEGECGPLLEAFTSCRSIEIEKPCEDCYITGILPDLVFEGTNTSVNYATGGMLHHVVNVNFSRWDVTCPPGFGDAINLLGVLKGGNERFYASGNERTHTSDIGGPGGSTYGYYVGEGDDWGLIYHLMNMNPEPITVEFKYTFSWVRDATRVGPVWLDIDQCGDSEVAIPAGYSDVHWETRAHRDGTLVGVGGHAHDHSISVSLENATTDEVMCVSKAGYAPGSPLAPTGPGAGNRLHPTSAHTLTSTGHPDAPLGDYGGHVADYQTCNPDISFDRGDTIRMHTQYYSPDGDDHAMGIMVAFVDWAPWWSATRTPSSGTA